MKKFNHLEFFEYERNHGMTPDTLAYRDLHYSLGLKIYQDLKPKSVLEIGCGSGALLEWFCHHKVNAVGVDNNPYHKEYFEKRNPHHLARYALWDLKNRMRNSSFDVIVSIECFEHLEDKVLEQTIDWTYENCKQYFVFSSTPNLDPDFDEQWGHVNVKPTKEWIKMFTDKGFKVYDRWHKPTQWTVVFSK